MRAAEGTGPPTKENPPGRGGLSRELSNGIGSNFIADSTSVANIFSTPAAVEVERRMDVAFFAGKAVRA
jgi:hypothetical protein